MKNDEQRLQRDCFLWSWNERKETRGRLFHVNNNADSKHSQSILKATGVLPGVSDFCFIGVGGALVGIELKTSIGKQSKAQKEWQKTIEAIGCRYYIVRTLEDFKLVIEANI